MVVQIHLLAVAADIPQLDVHLILSVVHVDVPDIKLEDSRSFCRPILVAGEFERVSQEICQVRLAGLKKECANLSVFFYVVTNRYLRAPQLQRLEVSLSGLGTIFELRGQNHQVNK